MSLLDWFRSVKADESSEPEERVEQETRTATREFELTHATITYPDESTEDLSYTQKKEEANSITLHPDSHYEPFTTHPMFGEDTVMLEMVHDSPRLFSLANIRDIEVNYVEELIAVAEVNVSVTYKGDDVEDIEIVDDDIGATVWERFEWYESGQR